MIISHDNWEGFIPVSYSPGLGGEFFAHLLHYRNEPFDSQNFPINKSGKFSYVNEEKPLIWNSDKSLFGWFLKSDYKTTIADHDILIQKLGLGNSYVDLWLDVDEYNRLCLAIAFYAMHNGGSLSMNVFNDSFIFKLKEILNMKDLKIETNDYKIAVVHPAWRWHTREKKYNIFNNAKAIQLCCQPQKGWIFWLLLYSKMYYYYIEYVKAGETSRKKFFDDLENNFIERANKYNIDYCDPFNRTVNHNLNINSYEMFFDKKDYSYILSKYLEQDFIISNEAIDYYYDINTRILNHFKLDHNDDFVSGRELYDRFMKYGPLHFEGKE